jgi:integral membrane sensor domain MASE1
MIPTVIVLIVTVLILAGVCLEVWRSQIVCWSLFVMFSILAVAWGFVSIEATKPFTQTELFVLRVLVAIFGLLAIWFFILAIRTGRKKDDHVA